MRRKTLVGLQFGKLQVLEKLNLDQKNQGYWYKCKCDCGKEVEKRSSNLRKDTLGCGCEKGSHNKINENGKQFGYLKVLGPSENKHPDSMLWKCECICGNIKDYKGNSLRRGLVKSCGCKKGELNSVHRRKIYSGLNKIFDNYKREAMNRNYTFELIKEDFKYLIEQECYYCGDRNSNTLNLKYMQFKYNGIDRINNNLGYNIKNCVSCCNICNEMKMDRTQEQFLNHVRKINEKK